MRLVLALLLLAPFAASAGPVAGVGLVAAVPAGDGPSAWGGQVTAGWAIPSIDGAKLLTPRFRFRGFPSGPHSYGGGVHVLYSPSTDDATFYVAFAGEVAKWDGCLSAAWCGTAFEAELEAGARLPLEAGRSAFLGISCAARVAKPFWPPPLVLPAVVGGFAF